MKAAGGGRLCRVLLEISRARQATFSRSRAFPRLLALLLITAMAALDALPVLAAAPYERLLQGAERTQFRQGGPRVFVHYARDTIVGRKLAAETALYLQSRGYDIVDLRAVVHSVSLPTVRYFFAEDQESAERIAGLFEAYLVSLTDEQTPARVQDFTRFRPQPSRGNIEVWLPAGLSTE
jgi:hypothetical protein